MSPVIQKLDKDSDLGRILHLMKLQYKNNVL